MKTKILISLLLCVLLFVNCQESQYLDESRHEQKEKVTVENIGRIHNKLLKAYFAKSQTRSVDVAMPENMSDCFDVFKMELLESNNYNISEDEILVLQSEISEFQEILSLPINDEFYNHSLSLVRNKIRLNDDISDDVKNVIYDIIDENCVLSADELYLLAEKFKNFKGGEYLMVYSNIFKASSEYWQPTITRNSNSRKVIAADCAGGLLGLGCGGVMSVIWAAAFSYSLDKCLDPMTVTVGQPEDTITYATTTNSEDE